MAVAAQGLELLVQTAVPSLITVGEILSISGPDTTRSELDTTVMGDSTRRNAGGLQDLGSVTLSLRLNYGDAGQDRVREIFAANTRGTWRIVVPAGALGAGAASAQTRLNFNGWVTRWQAISASVDGLIEANLTIRIDDTDIEEVEV